MKDLKDVVVLFCAPLSKFPRQPKDISKCTLVDCPDCGEKMWLSSKKARIKELAEVLEKK